MANDEKRKTVVERIDCDTGRLYGDIDDAIAYLTEMRGQYQGAIGFGLEEHWTGYEDMEMVLSFDRLENDAEYRQRLQQEEWERKRAAEDKRDSEQKAKDLKEFNRLKSKLGYY